MLVLEDGAIFRGRSFGSDGESLGEVVFNTSMMGYPEILTDPSYRGQMVCMTYPLIGNYGINPEDFESRRIFLNGFIVKECSRLASNYRSKITLPQLLQEAGIVGIEGIDTRRLVRHIREEGAMKGVISTIDLEVESLLEKVRSSAGLIGRDLVSEVTVDEPYEWHEPLRDRHTRNPEFSVVALDLGIKFNILRSLVTSGCKVTVVPAYTSAEEILAYDPDGIFLSNGPGDPSALISIIEEVKKLIDRKPVFGICLGHQLLVHAMGGSTYKLKFGHHGGNHPVANLEQGQIEITVQNHGFAVDMDSAEGLPLKLTHINLNDQTVEGLSHMELPVFSVQYHPEAGPGPHDSRYLFEKFTDLMRTGAPAAPPATCRSEVYA